LEKISHQKDFWPDREKVREITQRMGKLKEASENFHKLSEELAELKELYQLAKEDKKLTQELRESYFELEKKISQKEKEIFLAGPYNEKNAILSILAGAGGKDGQDWATMLLRMYERYCQRTGFKTKILEQSFGEGRGPERRIGTKSVTLEIRGKWAYGLLKKENGVHRLVRISPFSAKALRHTSFALIEVMPEIPNPRESNLKIRPEDLKIEFFKASGPGGQYVNKRMTAVRITHLPTKTVVSCQSERFQAQNREKAMTLLYSRFYRLLEESREKELSKIRGEKISVSWGNQIRNYVLHPYKIVKDLRTGIEMADVESVLDGNLEKFIKAEIKYANNR
jgi:peptide chain release factor 2